MYSVSCFCVCTGSVGPLKRIQAVSTSQKKNKILRHVQYLSNLMYICKIQELYITPIFTCSCRNHRTTVCFCNTEIAFIYFLPINFLAHPFGGSERLTGVLGSATQVSLDTEQLVVLRSTFTAARGTLFGKKGTTRKKKPRVWARWDYVHFSMLDGHQWVKPKATPL